MIEIKKECQNLDLKDINEIRIILPMRNEAYNAGRIIANVAKEILPISNCYVSVVDSDSSDSTFSLAKQALENSLLPRDRWEVITTDIPGKSHAINLILDSTNSDLYVMIDADVAPQEGWLFKLKKGISTVGVGVISGIESNFQNKSNLRGIYKNYSHEVRIKQSQIDTTPILEGGLICWRKAALGDDFRLNEDSNADDAQIAFQAIRNGRRTLLIEDLFFEDLGGKGANFQRSVRRSQGLCRVIVSNIDLCLVAPRKEARKSISHAFILYVLFPWALICFLFNPVLVITLYDDLTGWPYLCIAGILAMATNRLGRSAIWGASISVIGHILFFLGIRFSSWN